MSSVSPVLDQPQSYDYELLPTGVINRLANQDLYCLVDANSDLQDVTWPWAGAVYARRITLAIADWQDGPLTPLAVRLFPGHQETIAGAEGMIVTKRLVTPWKSPDDKALIFLLECQAEGDRLLKLEIDIDWGEPLSQRIVDGLLLAQRNPEPARGIYGQSNAESTRVFGNPYGRPDEVHIDDPQRARLVYHVLVNGMVEVPLLLTVSDVGEQVAWNGFLSLRDVEQVFDASSEAWSRQLRAGRLWTPDPAFNHAVHDGKLEAIRRVQRLRSGWSPSDLRVQSILPLVNAWDAIDPAVSRNLLAHLRRLAEECDGALPELLPALPHAALAPVDIAAVLHSVLAYVGALHAHLRHHADADLLAAHLPAVRLCAERLIRLRTGAPGEVNGGMGNGAGSTPAQGHGAGTALWQDNLHAAACTAALAAAARLAQMGEHTVDAARWESEAAYLQSRAAASALPSAAGGEIAAGVPADNGAPSVADKAPAWLDTVQTAGAAVWDGCGICWREGEQWIEPTWLRGGSWWALLSLPLANGKHLSLLWDGTTLFATQPVRSSLGVVLCKSIRIHQADEFDFDPYFELTRASDAGDTGVTQRFKPKFQTL
jgi:hypothetical protein